MINETLAKQYWPSEDPVGQTITASFYGQVITPQIVGVIGDVRPAGLDSDPRPELFLPPITELDRFDDLRRAHDRRSAAAAPCRERGNLGCQREPPFCQYRDAGAVGVPVHRRSAFNLLFLGSFAGIALMLAGIGIYGLISFSTRLRHEEIRVRMALAKDCC